MPTLQASVFLERLLRFLIPYFTDVTADIAVARAEALETLAAYGARTRAELLCAVQIIVFSFTAFETLAEANTPGMSPSMRLRFRGCANNLNRSSQKTEQTLAIRLACDAPQASDVKTEPVNDLSEPQAEEILRQTQDQIEASRNRAGNASASAPRPAQNLQTGTLPLKQPSPVALNQSVLLTQEEKNKRLWGAAMMDTLAQMGMPVKPIPGTRPASGG